jgi:chitin synthase
MGDYRPQFPPSNPPNRGEGLDPFADRPHQITFTEPEPPYRGSPHGSPGSVPRPFESTATLPSEFGGQETYDDEDYIEKQPLNAGGSFTGGFYPPAYVSSFHSFRLS